MKLGRFFWEGLALRGCLKLYAGVALFVLAWLMPLLGFWITTLPLPISIKSLIAGLLTIGGPEVFCIAAIALLGKQTFDLFTGKVLAVLKRMTPQGSVSKTRYLIGLVLFSLSFIPNYVVGYAPHLLPDLSPFRLYVFIGADLLFVASLFILGGDFWDKIRALFVYDARAQFPGK
jgi:hypothetical protein